MTCPPRTFVQSGTCVNQQKRHVNGANGMIGSLALRTSGLAGTASAPRLFGGQPGPHVSPIAPAPDNETSFELLLKARSGAPDAQNRLCAHYLPRLHRWARGRLPQSARGALDTGDIVQDVLISALKHVSVFEPQHEWSFQAYLRQSLMNRLRDEARRVRNRPFRDQIDSSHPSRDPAPLEQAIGTEAIERYEAALARLRPEEQQIIVARCEWGMSHQEVADLLGKRTSAAAQVAVHRALIRLAKEMARDRQ
jgi:RNA polymerase sigma factor (sigma-70 family)